MVQAQQPAADEMLWNCVSVDDGKEWQCSGNPQAGQQPPASAPTAEPTAGAKTATAAPAPGSAGQPPPLADERSQGAEAGVDQPPQPLTLEPLPPPQPASGQSASAPVTPTQSAQSPQSEAAQSGSRQQSASRQPDDQTRRATAGPQGLNYLASYPDAYAQPSRRGAEAPAQSARPSAPEGQWDCQPSSDGQRWQCQPMAAPLATTRAAAPVTTAHPYAYLDWYSFSGPVDPVSHCDGEYIEPLLQFPDAQLPTEDQPLRINANSSRTEGGNLTILEGDILLRKGNQQLRSQSGRLDHQRGFAELQGQVLFREPGTLILSDSAEFDRQQGQTRLYNAQYVIQPRHLRGSAARIVHLATGDTYIRDGVYTRCEPGNDSWTINSSDIVLYREEGYGVAKHATLRVAGVPVFYLPIISFPIDDRRKSGFLTPSLAHSEDNGLDIAAPYYFNLAPDYDATVIPRYISRRGLMLETELRYLHSSGEYDLSLAALPNDDRRQEDRWLFGIDHSGSPAPGWSSLIDFTSISDNDYFDELDTSLNISQETHLDQMARIAYNGDDWQASAKVQSYQTITTADKPYQKLPELRISGGQNVSDSDVRLEYSAGYTNFDRDSTDFSGIDAITGSRLHLDTSLSTEYVWPWAYVRPKLKLTHTSYQLSNQPSGDAENPNRTLPLLSIDSGVYFDRETEFAGKAYTHTLEPRLYYLYVPVEDQSTLPVFDASELTFSYSQLFRENRFSGSDRIGDTQQLTLGLTTRFLEDSGSELFHVSAGQIFYFKDRQVRLEASDPLLTDSTSNFAGETVWQVTEHLRLTADGEWDNHSFSNTKRNLKLSYRSDIDHLFNIGYRFTRDSLEQTDLSFMWPINNRWSVLGRWLQDIENSEALDQVLGLEYENCCWRIRTVYREWIDDDTDDRENSGVFLQFTLKGLGTVGTRAAGDAGPKAKNFLEDITGFKERENDE